MASAVQIQSLIVDQLARGEMEFLALVVAVRRRLGSLESPKGDLTTVVKCALRTLVASKAVVDHDGRYSLSARSNTHPPSSVNKTAVNNTG